ncbi:thioredoxin [[Clostridium] polysaccharolyticum]|uniref:Thioredoxin n=1 Tax=[Clostridium] polysaccharolyticum TaxID=29364 RepID=A0A1I0B5K4_9FIRM|nr:thioredoxin [[Clostridium] polysaccharolyticum]SET01674.1 thioredoxin [[Clostridium] polysaccharolyticum]
MAIIDVKKTNFEKEVLGSSTPVLIDFFANWCMPCKMLAPIIQEISKEHNGLKVCRINVESEPELAEAFQIMSLPTLIYLKDGIVKEQSVGFCNKEVIKKMLKQ